MILSTSFLLLSSAVASSCESTHHRGGEALPYTFHIQDYSKTNDDRTATLGKILDDFKKTWGYRPKISLTRMRVAPNHSLALGIPFRIQVTLNSKEQLKYFELLLFRYAEIALNPKDPIELLSILFGDVGRIQAFRKKLEYASDFTWIHISPKRFKKAHEIESPDYAVILDRAHQLKLTSRGSDSPSIVSTVKLWFTETFLRSMKLGASMSLLHGLYFYTSNSVDPALLKVIPSIGILISGSYAFYQGIRLITAPLLAIYDFIQSERSPISPFGEYQARLEAKKVLKELERNFRNTSTKNTFITIGEAPLTEDAEKILQRHFPEAYRLIADQDLVEIPEVEIFRRTQGKALREHRRQASPVSFYEPLKFVINGPNPRDLNQTLSLHR